MAEDSVRKCYRQILEREAESGGLTNWVNYLMSGHSVKEMVRSFGHSDEYRQRFVIPHSAIEAAKLAYRHFLAREVESEAAALSHATVLVNQGYHTMINGFIDSPEYNDRFGNHLVPFQ